MVQRLTEGTRRVAVVLAHEEATRLHHDHIGTEHLLLGLIRVTEDTAARVLQSLGISLEDVRRRVEEIIGRGEREPEAFIPFTPAAKRALQEATHESLLLGHDYIGTEHILLSLVGDGDGVAAQILSELGAGPGRVRQEVSQQLASH